MKILFLHRFRNFAGAERQLVELARGLAERGHAITVVTFYASDRVSSLLEPAGIRVISLDKSGRWDLAGFGWRLLRVLRRERADLVHGYLGFANAVLALTKPLHRAKVVWGVRSSDIDISRYDRLARFDAWIEATLSRFPALIISNSQSGKASAIQRGFPAHKVIVIPNGVDLHRFQRSEAERARVRAEWGVSTGTKVVGRVGRIDPQKDFETFLRAAKIISAERSDIRFALVASDPHGMAEQLRAFAADLGLGPELIWNNPREDMAAVYSAFDLNVSSSAYGEGVPNVLVEAMACGVPCVTTDVGDSALTIVAPGQVVPREDPATLATAITSVLDQPADRAALRQSMADRFSMDRLVSTSEHAFTAVLAGVAPTRIQEQASW
jgi:glycosyltransferase involved in cell wall biosynthesis